MLRVVVSDGFLSGQDTSGLIGLPLHAPEVTIASPNQNQVFFPTQQVSLQGSAYDQEDGVLGDAALTWSSSINGVLGTGASLNTTELSTGTHVITLTATDSNGMTSQAQRTITVAQEDAQEVLNLGVAPLAVVVDAAFGGAPVNYGVSLTSSGSTDISWTAAENIPWLTVNTASGQTPYDLVLTINPSLAIVGGQTGTITFTSAQAANSPIVLNVNLTVSGNRVNLPMVTR